MDTHVNETDGLDYTNKVKRRKHAVKPESEPADEEAVDPVTGKKKR